MKPLRNKSFVALLIGLAASLTLPHAHAGYTMTVLRNGLSFSSVAPGETFHVGVFLSTTANDVHDASVFRLNFSEPGLRYDSYSWSLPYGNGGMEDDSKPALTALPQSLNADLLAGPAYPAGQVDIEFSNLVADPTKVFDNGRLVDIGLSVPLDYAGPNRILIDALPIELVRGFQLVPTVAGRTFELTIVPEPTPVQLLGAGALLFLGASLWRRSRAFRNENARSRSFTGSSQVVQNRFL